MFYFHTMADFTVGQGARRKASTAVATVVRFGYERLIVNVDGNEYEWYPAECIPVAIETPQAGEASTMATYLGATATFDHACQCAAAHHHWDSDETMGDLPDTTDRNYYVSVNKVHDCYPFFRAASMADVLATFSYWPLGDLYPIAATNLAPTAKG